MNVEAISPIANHEQLQSNYVNLFNLDSNNEVNEVGLKSLDGAQFNLKIITGDKIYWRLNSISSKLKEIDIYERELKGLIRLLVENLYNNNEKDTESYFDFYNRLEEVTKQNLRFSIIKEIQQNFLDLQDKIQKYKNGTVDFNLIDFASTIESIKRNIKEQTKVAVRGEEENSILDLLSLSEFFESTKNDLEGLINQIPTTFISSFYSQDCSRDEHKFYKYLNPNQVDREKPANEILSRFNIEKSFQRRKGEIGGEKVFFKSNFLFLAFNTSHPQTVHELHFSPNNIPYPRLEPNYAMGLLFAGLENLIYALDNNLFGEKQDELKYIGNTTNLKQGKILLSFGFELILHTEKGPLFLTDKKS